MYLDLRFNQRTLSQSVRIRYLFYINKYVQIPSYKWYVCGCTARVYEASEGFSFSSSSSSSPTWNDSLIARYGGVVRRSGGRRGTEHERGQYAQEQERFLLSSE